MLLCLNCHLELVKTMENHIIRLIDCGKTTYHHGEVLSCGICGHGVIRILNEVRNINEMDTLPKILEVHVNRMI